MYKVIGLNGEEMSAESFTEALKILYEFFSRVICSGRDTPKL